MKTDSIIFRLAELGVSLSVAGERLAMRPGSKVPQALRDEVRDHKEDLIVRLAPREPNELELDEIQARVRRDGLVLLWSTVLADTVAFVRADADGANVPGGFTIYTLFELTSLFGGEPLSEYSLRLIHQVKKHGGRIIDQA
jgi:hypothetical protein